jgi:KDO2-lipid IV(A) lauroyltransferase
VSAAISPGARDARDLRSGGTWSRGQALKNELLWLAARASIAATGPLPLGWLRALGRGVAALAFVLFGRARRTAAANVARAFPELDARARATLVRRAYATLGAHLGEAIAMLHRAPSPLPMAPASRDVLSRALARGRGVVFASAHLGPWERVAGALVAAGLPLWTIAREAYDPRFTALYDRVRAHQGVRSIYRGAPGAAARIVRTLRAGGVLGVPMDLRSRVESVDAPFLGHAAPTPIGPARIALRTGAAVVVGTAARVGGELVVTATEIATEDLGGDERALTARINDELSRRIRAMPDAWVWMHERFL